MTRCREKPARSAAARSVVLPVAAHRHQAQRRVLGPQPLGKLVAVDDRQPDVEQRQVRHALAASRERLEPVVRHPDLVAQQLQHLGDALRGVHVVVHHQDLQPLAPGHGVGSLARRGAAAASGGLRRERQAHGEGASLAHAGALHLHRSAVQLGEALHQRQARGPAHPSPGRRPGAPGRTSRTPGAGARARSPRRRRGPRPRARGPSRRATTVMCPPGSVYFAALCSRLKSTCPSRGGSATTRSPLTGDRHAQVVPALLEERADLLHRRGHHRRQLHRLALELDLPPGDAGDVEQVVHQPRQVLHLPLEDAPLPLQQLRRAQAHQLEAGEHRRERVAELVAQHGQELVLGPVRLLRRLTRPHQVRHVGGHHRDGVRPSPWSSFNGS